MTTIDLDSTSLLDTSPVSTETAQPASQAQYDLSLKLGREAAELAEGREDRAEMLEAVRYSWRQISGRQAASSWIECVIAIVKRWRTEDRAAQKSTPVEVPEGMHQTSDGRIFKVQRSQQSGNLYAKLLKVGQEEVDGDPVVHGFEYARGALRLLSEDTKMTLEKAKKFGALYGTCCVCGRTLTDEGSITAGIGPVCASKF